MEFPLFIREPDKKVKTLIRKLTHSGETELDKDTLAELKSICKKINDDNLIVIIFKECMKCLEKEHSQVRVATVKLIDYLFNRSHLFRTKLLDDFDTFLELTLAVTPTPKIKLNLPPPKKYASLLQEFTAKLIHTWHSEYGPGYEKLRYAYKYLKEHQLVDFSQFRVQTHEDLIKRQKLVEKQEKILTRLIEKKIDEFSELKPEIEQILAQIESLLEILVPITEDLTEISYINESENPNNSTENLDRLQQRHGIANLSQSINIEFTPFIEIKKNSDNLEIIQNMKELKAQLVEVKLRKLLSIEKALLKRSDRFVDILRSIIDTKTKCTKIILRLGELRINDELDEDDEISKKRKHSSNLDNVHSDSDESSEFEDVEPKEDLETYIPKSMRYEYGLEPIDPKELDSSNKISLTDEISALEPGCSNSLVLACSVKLESGKLCPRRDKVKCPFHGPIIPRDHNGIPINEKDRIREEKLSSKKVPDWQDPELLADIKRMTGVDLTMPKKGKAKETKLANTKTCDLTPKQRLQKKLKLLNK